MITPLQVIENMQTLGNDLSKLNKELARVADLKSESERDYRKALAIEIFRLRDSGIPVTVINDLARGATADLKFERDKYETLYEVTRDSIRTVRDRISIGQSILNWLKEEYKATGREV